MADNAGAAGLPLEPGTRQGRGGRAGLGERPLLVHVGTAQARLRAGRGPRRHDAAVPLGAERRVLAREPARDRGAIDAGSKRKWVGPDSGPTTIHSQNSLLTTRDAPESPRVKATPAPGPEGFPRRGPQAGRAIPSRP